MNIVDKICKGCGKTFRAIQNRLCLVFYPVYIFLQLLMLFEFVDGEVTST